MIIGFIIGLAAAAGTPASAAPPKQVKERLVCHETEQTGSRLGNTRVCKTESQWRDDSVEIQTQVDATMREDMRVDPERYGVPPQPR